MRSELITTARRGRYYVARVIYGLFLLALLQNRFERWEASHPAGGTIDDIHDFAESAFVEFAGAQGLTLLLMIPALVGGVIADDHQRKTLHYLLASRLSSAEIVLGKLGAQLLHVVIFVALGLPVVALLGLYGGINPEYVFHVYLCTFSVVLFVAGLSILVSTLARRPREAIVAAYGLEAAWLFGPAWIRPFAHDLGGVFFWVGAANDWMLMSNPFQVWLQLTRVAQNSFWRSRLGAGAFLQFHELSYWMSGLQIGFGLSFLTLAIVGLRPLRGSSWPGGEPKDGWWTRMRRRLHEFERSRTVAAVARNELLATRSNRPPCGDDPIRWKERHTTMGGGLRWLGGRPVVLFFSVLLGCYVFEVVTPVVRGWFRGYSNTASLQSAHASFTESTMALAILGILAIASTAAVSLTGEREQDTWISLATTLLTPREIIRGKQFGAIWSARRIGLAIFSLWSVGMAMGAIHPLGVLAATCMLGLVCWSVATIGVLISTRAKSSTRALTMTFIVLMPFLYYSSYGLAVNPLISYDALSPRRDFSNLGRPPADVVREVAALVGWTAVVLGSTALVASDWSIRRLRTHWGEA